MVWVKLDENFARHPKVVKAGPLGMAMQAAALCYCNQYLTDGLVPHSAVPGLLNLEGYDDWQEVVDKLIEAVMWVEVEGGYQIHDYLDYQPSKEEVLADREKKKLAGQKGGKASSQARQSKNNASSEHKPSGNDKYSKELGEQRKLATIPGANGLEEQHVQATIPDNTVPGEQHVRATIPEKNGPEEQHMQATIPDNTVPGEQHVQATIPDQLTNEAPAQALAIALAQAHAQAKFKPDPDPDPVTDSESDDQDLDSGSDPVTDSCLDTHARTQKHGQGENFRQFWEAYPKKQSKGYAEKAWNKIRPDRGLFAAIMAALERAKSSVEWTKNNGQYIPYPAKWLNGRCWEDELTPKQEEVNKHAGADRPGDGSTGSAIYPMLRVIDGEETYG